MVNATQPFACDGGVSDRVMRVINRFASVPAGFPEPYPNRRFTSDAEGAVGLGREP
jgi:hypothetical protein